MSRSYLELAALACVAYVVIRLVKFIFGVVYTYAIGPAINAVDLKAQGKWALVTGCTDGIGKEYARQIAQRGLNIVLISRSMDKLKATAQEIENEFKVSTKIIQVDFSGSDEIYQHIAKEIADLEIGTLVNNVGVSYVYPERFLDMPDWDNMISTLIKANMVSMTRMTKIVLPDMVKRGKGVVINIGSGSSLIPSPMLCVYAATKAYVEKFSEDLEWEYKKSGVIFQCVMPGFVCSNMTGIRKSSFFAPTAKTFVKSALALIGTTNMTTGFFPHSILIGTVKGICNLSSTLGVWLITRSMENSRSRSLKKKGKLEKLEA
ncbi:unnamed protein product [Chrysodeixis includens]|uniref:Very-long-chain 3-oxoacyl-CoA reductase n=1 Tax=Chrysodeixis includens TaxID=689277 RepID=A0A9P0BY07_CHRIL|nr:unnamed protein product [Chrysodeixis includens]